MCLLRVWLLVDSGRTMAYYEGRNNDEEIRSTDTRAADEESARWRRVRETKGGWCNDKEGRQSERSHETGDKGRQRPSHGRLVINLGNRDDETE